MASNISDQVKVGDLVDFGPFGKLFVCDTTGSSFRVTSNFWDRANPNAKPVRTIDKTVAREIVGSYGPDAEEDDQAALVDDIDEDEDDLDEDLGDEDEDEDEITALDDWSVFGDGR